MSKVLEFPNMTEVKSTAIVNDEFIKENNLKVKRTEELICNINEVSDFIKALPLSTEDNNDLVHKFSRIILDAEREAFKQGFSFGYEVAECMEVDEI
jgi:predicted metal-binding protein